MIDEDPHSPERLFDVMRLGDAAMGRHFEAHALMMAPRRWWPLVRETVAQLQAQGIRLECRESRGWFSRDFFIRCDDAALPALHMVGDRIRWEYFHG